MQKISCPNCGQKGYKLDREIQEVEGVKYEELIPYCPKCDHWFYVDEIQKENNARRRNAIREARGLCSYEELLSLPKKYGMPRKLLTEIMGLDKREGFFISVWDGEVPTAEESRVIRMAHDPRFFMALIEKSKDKIPGDKYEKVHRRVESMIGRLEKGR